MKRLLSLILATFMCLSLAACNPAPADKNASSGHSSAAGLQSSNTSTQSEGKDEFSYRDIVCEKASGYKQVCFSISGSKKLLCINVPKEWSLQKNGSGYGIFKNSKQIGTVSTAADTIEGATAVFSTKNAYSGVNVNHDILCVDSDTGEKFTRTIRYAYKDDDGKQKSITVTVPYEKLDSEGLLKMMEDTTTAVPTTESKAGILPIKDSRKRILIVGNSFIGTSSIGSILQKMCGSDLAVEAISRGNATVTTYTDDEDMMSRIRAGAYSAVFVCGFYDTASSSNFKIIVDACKASNTKAVMFPAHNESRYMITVTCEDYPDATLIDWKAEIDGLIEYGVDYYDFCINDGPQHSTPLAGYVGAHMIYRAIFGTAPKTTTFDNLSSAQISKLGKYVTSGEITLIEESAIYYIN